ncbi:MAG: hypothetical protein K0S65_1415 [Labilithrix sp.]|nr:hypothetical protein [Labilithrix sp.]
MPGSSRLFHAIVVLGAALAGCGGRTDRPREDAGRGPSNDGAPDAGETSDAGSDCVGTAQRVEDCASPADFVCESCSSSVSWKCRCENGSPESPDACEKPQDYRCQRYAPLRTGCRCVPGSPSADSDCDAGSFLSCRGTNPPIACDCITVITR